MKTKFRVFTALLLALMVLVSVLPLQAAAEIGQSGTATRAEAENTAEAALSVKPMLTPSYTPSASYRSGKYYTQLCNVSLTGNQRTDLVNVARSQLGYHEGDNTSQLHGESSGSRNYTEYGYWYGTQVQGNSGGSYYAWCAYFISWCARQAGIPTSIISNASYACAGSDNGDFKNLDYYARGSYTPKVGDLVFFCWEGNSSCWDHVEIVIGVDSSNVTTLGGNTSTNNVKTRSWKLSNSYIRGYGVPKYTSKLDAPYVYSIATGPWKTYVEWYPVKGATSYELRIYAANDTANPVNTVKSITNTVYGIKLSPGEYYTSVTAVNPNYSPTYTTGPMSPKFTVPSTNDRDPLYPKASTFYNGHLYILYDVQTGCWDQANEMCNTWGGHLVTINSAQEQAVVYELAKKSSKSYCKIGAKANASRQWSWVTGENFSYANWKSGQPDNYNGMEFYAEMDIKAGGTWDDCANVRYGDVCFIVEHEMNETPIKTYSVDNKVKYAVFDKAMPWEDAKNYCEQLGGHLATISNKAEQDIIAGLIVNGSRDAYSIGATKRGLDNWSWIDGKEFSYTNWDDGYPVNPYGEGYYIHMVKSGKWHDIYNITHYGFVCEFELPYTLTINYLYENGSTAAPSYTARVNYGDTYSVTSPNVQGHSPSRQIVSGTMGATNMSVDVVYSINTYTVTFKDWNGTVLKTQQVQYGGAATAPANPTRTGYTFTGWDKAFTNVTTNLVVTAQYSINTYTVTFKDWNGTVLKTQQVQYGGAATAPANPTRTGYTFTGWDKAFTNVTANLVVTAQYSINTYTVTFKDWNGTVLKTQQVQYGGAATAPANPTRTGYTFTGWDKAFTNVTANLVVTAQYVQNEPVSTPVPSDVPQIVVESKTTSAGSTVAVNISIANNPGIVSMTLHVNFDSRLELVSVQDTGLLPGQVHPTVMINPYTLVWANDSATQNYTVNGTIATLNFNVPENLEEGDYAISVSYDNDEYEIYDCNAETIDFAVVNGKISVTDIIYGDVNGDGKVNNLDRLVLTRYLANWPDYPASRIKPGADTNADGKINNLDRLILTRHLANWPDYATLPWSSGKSGSAAVEPTSYTKGNEPTVIVNSVEAMPGETVSVSIDIANNPGIISMTLDVAFDPSLTLLSVDNTGLFPGYIPCAVMQNPYTLVWANDAASEDIYVNGTIVNFVFKVADDAEPGSYSIVVTYNLDDYDIYNYNSEPVEFAIQNGAVTVAAAQPEMHTVTFKDWDGTVLKTQEVQYGGDAEAPADPTRVGYTFTGWDKAFTNITADLVVTAQYEINTYTVTFKDWDGTVLKTQEVQYGGDAEAPADPTRVGYTFTGWDKAFTNIMADLVVTAQYEINTYTVTFKDWDGTVLKTQEVQHGGDAEAPADPTRVGYTFTGWDKAFTNIMADLVVTAQYEINTYTVTFKDWNGTVLKTQEVQHGGDAEAPADPTRVGYTFTGWDKAFTNIMADLVVTAQYEINTYTVTFKDWNGTVLKTQEVQYGGDAEAPADPTRTGYTFTGWDKAFTNVTADLVVTAQYEINTYTVTFKDWDGTELKTQEVQHGGDAEAPADPTRVGYTFTGWDEAFTNIMADLVVTAKYEINTYTVTFKDWDGTELKTQEVQYGGDAEAPADPTRTGYTFTGWDKAFTNIMADLVVTAQYSINTYTVTFKDWNGTVLKTQEVQYGGDAEAPADPTRVGYTFTGWDKAFTNITADLVVTAQYEINTYTVTFKDWDGTVLKTQEVQHGGDAEAPADPTRVGYTFTGWDKAFTNIMADLVVTAQYEMLGDVDGDGNVSMADALTILRMAMDILPVENQQIADVDGDGFITSMDALLALRFAMHIEQ